MKSSDPRFLPVYFIDIPCFDHVFNLSDIQIQFCHKQTPIIDDDRESDD